MWYTGKHKIHIGSVRQTDKLEFVGELGIDSLRRGRVSRTFAQQPIYRFAPPFWVIFPLAAGGETPPLRPYKLEFVRERDIDSLRRGRVSRPFAQQPIYRFAPPFWEIFPLAAGGETPPLRPYKLEFVGPTGAVSNSRSLRTSDRCHWCGNLPDRSTISHG